MFEPDLVEIVDVSFPDFGLASAENIPGPDVEIRVSDVNNLAEQDSSNMLLARLVILGKQPGTVDIAISVSRMDDDAGMPINPRAAQGTVNVVVYPILTGMDSSVRDLDRDGRPEDLNGNGRLDFADALAILRNLESASVQEHSDLFDYNGNGLPDFGDMVALLDRMWEQGQGI